MIDAALAPLQLHVPILTFLPYPCSKLITLIAYFTVIDRNEAEVDLVLTQPILPSDVNDVDLMLTSVFHA